MLALKDGRRVYPEYTTDDSGRALKEELKLVDGETYPILEDDAGVFWYRPDVINERFDLTGPSLH